MDQSKKRKIEENGVVGDGGVDHNHLTAKLTPEDARKIVERFTPDQLIDILGDAASRHDDVLDAVRSVADADTSRRKLFVRGLGWDTTTDGLRSVFSAFGEIDEAVVILDKATGKSKGYGFVTFRHVDGAVLALKDPSKKIDGRMTVTQLAAAGNSSSGGVNGSSTVPANPASGSGTGADVSMRKIYVANVPYEMVAEKLLAHFALYGEIEEGPLGFDKQTGKCRGYALFVYKTAEGARAALVDPVKTIDGRQLNCKLAIDGKKGKTGGGGGDGVQAPVGSGRGDPGMGAGPGQGPGPVPHGSMPGLGQFGPGRMGSYGGFPGGPGGPVGHHYPGAEMAGPYGGGYGGGAGGGGGAGNGGLGGAASSLYRLPPHSGGGMPGSGGYPESGHYGLSSASGYPGQHHQPPGASSMPRVPPGGMYPPPYY